MIYDDSIPCLYGRDNAPFGVRSCSSWYCPRCHRGQRNRYASLLLRDFDHRPPDWFDDLHFVVLRPCHLIQNIAFDDGILLAVQVLKQFHVLLRQQYKYGHFSLTEDTAWDERTRQFHPSIHSHLLMHGELSKARVREVYVQAHQDMLVAAGMGDFEPSTVYVYCEPCNWPRSAALYICKHGKYRQEGRAFRGIDLRVHKRNPTRIDYTRQGKAGVPFFSRPTTGLMFEVKQQWEDQRERRKVRRWSPSPGEPLFPTDDIDVVSEAGVQADHIAYQQSSVVDAEAAGDGSPSSITSGPLHEGVQPRRRGSLRRGARWYLSSLPRLRITRRIGFLRPPIRRVESSPVCIESRSCINTSPWGSGRCRSPPKSSPLLGQPKSTNAGRKLLPHRDEYNSLSDPRP